MKTEIVARTGVVRRPGHSYYLVGDEVWERKVGANDDDRGVRVASATFTREPGYMHFLDGDGNIVRIQQPPVSLDEDDELQRARWGKFFERSLKQPTRK